jgi:hypothetical protein
MPPREGENAGGSAQAAASRRKADQDSDLKADVDVDCRFQDQPDDDHVIQNLDKIGRMKLCRPEFVEELKRDHREFTAFCLKHYHDILKEEEEARNAAAAAAAKSETPSCAGQQ